MNLGIDEFRSATGSNLNDLPALEERGCEYIGMSVDRSPPTRRRCNASHAK